MDLRRVSQGRRRRRAVSGPGAGDRGPGAKLTAPSQPEKGRPLLRAKAKVWRDVDARALMVMTTSSASTSRLRPVAARTEPVAVKKTWMKG